MSGTARRRAREREVRRSAILEAAREIHREKGLAAATMEDVAHRAELSKGALYLYFPSKEVLFLALALRPLENVLERFEEVRRSGVTGLDRLERYMHAHARSLVEHRDVFRLGIALRQEREAVMDGGSEVACVFREHKSQVFRAYVEALEEAQAAGAVREGRDARMVATQIWASLVGAAVIQVEADRRCLPDDVAPEEALAMMPDLLMAAIGARADENAAAKVDVPAERARRGRRA